jgi:hypothetical protein
VSAEVKCEIITCWEVPVRPIQRSGLTEIAWSRPVQLDFSHSTQVTAIQRVFGTPTPATNDCLALWDDDISGARSLSADEVSALKAIQDRVNNVYKSASPHLLDDVGLFCAYCETPLDAASQLEHVLPKSQFPTFALDWDNFVPACGACNIRKSKSPLRSTVAVWLGPTRCTPADCHREIRSGRFRWPDLDEVDGYFDVSLFYEDPGGVWTQCGPLDAVSSTRLDGSQPSIVTGEVRAALPTLGLTNVAVAALITAVGGEARASATIGLCRLDTRPQPRGHSDTRTFRRTKAWLLAVGTLRLLSADGLPALLPETVGDLIVSTGFYWVWLTVARSIDPNLARLVIDGTKHQLPGTDLARLP